MPWAPHLIGAVQAAGVSQQLRDGDALGIARLRRVGQPTRKLSPCSACASSRVADHGGMACCRRWPRHQQLGEPCAAARPGKATAALIEDRQAHDGQVERAAPAGRAGPARRRLARPGKVSGERRCHVRSWHTGGGWTVAGVPPRGAAPGQGQNQDQRGRRPRSGAAQRTDAARRPYCPALRSRSYPLAVEDDERHCRDFIARPPLMPGASLAQANANARSRVGNLLTAETVSGRGAHQLIRTPRLPCTVSRRSPPRLKPYPADA